MKKIALLLIVMTTAAAVCAEEQFFAGTVKQLQGTATAVRSDKKIDLSLDAAIFTGDVIATGQDARLLLNFRDDSELVMGSETEFEIKSFDYFPNSGKGNGVLRYVRGFFQSVSGHITGLKKAKFTVETDMGVVGIRGTTVWGGHLESEKFEVVMVEGTAVTVSTDTGAVELNQMKQGTAITAADAAPTAPEIWSAAKLKKAAAMISFDGECPAKHPLLLYP